MNNTTPQPSGRPTTNSPSMTTPAPMSQNINLITPQVQINTNPTIQNKAQQNSSNTVSPMLRMPQQMTGNMPGMPYGIPSGMQSGVGQEMPYYYNPNMPYMHYAPYQGIPNMTLPNNAYNVPMGIPLFPLYGYDNSADLDRDVEYMKRLYPKTAKTILKEVDNECDHMEYEGSMMFDEYPDKETLERLIDNIYNRIKVIEEEPEVEMNSLYFYPPRRNQDHLRDIVSLILLSEIFNRRRRHRSRRRWF